MVSHSIAVLSQANAVFQFHLMKLFVLLRNFWLQVGMYCPVGDPRKIFVSPVLGGGGIEQVSILFFKDSQF